ncbi:MAG TPA: biotin/lipoyl-binding protein [Candidatus Omnitrophica bacterium]|nr:biotin/lipoyl-binding protein [Candidatus Omnitrophota bacterium]
MGKSSIEIKLPELGKEVEEATVSFWYQEEGEDVEKDEELLEIVTDKAVFKVKAPVSGRLSKILVGENEKVKIGDILGIIESEVI